MASNVNVMCLLQRKSTTATFHKLQDQGLKEESLSSVEHPLALIVKYGILQPDVIANKPPFLTNIRLHQKKSKLSI